MTRKRVAAVILLQLLLGALVAINTSEAKPSEVVMEAEAPAAGTPTVIVEETDPVPPSTAPPPTPSGGEEASARRNDGVADDGVWSSSVRLPSSALQGRNSGASVDGLLLTDRLTRRLHKWDKDDTMKDSSSSGGGESLAESLSAMASTLLEDGNNSLENSSERDVFMDNHDDNTEEEASGEASGETPQQEEGGATPPSDETQEEEEGEESNGNIVGKSDVSMTTPKGLTTWSAVGNNNNGNGKLPSEYTVSSSLSFAANTERTQTTLDGGRTTFSFLGTTEMPVRTTTKKTLSKKKPPVVRRPYNKNKKIVQPSKFVKPALEEVTAEAVGTDATHTIYKTRVTAPSMESKIVEGSATTKKPYVWPYQMTTRRALTTRRPPFSRMTTKPKLPTVKKPSSGMSTFSSMTTTTPASTTVYNRQPAPVMMYPFPSISFTNLGFMDFLRSQIIPRIGLSLISFMAASPLILSMLGANALGRRRRRRRRRDLSSEAKFQPLKDAVESSLKNFDFTTLKKKLEKLQKEGQKQQRSGSFSWARLAGDFLLDLWGRLGKNQNHHDGKTSTSNVNL